MLLIASGEVGEDELREQSGWKFSEESSHRATSPRAARGRQFARPGSIIKHFIFIENIFLCSANWGNVRIVNNIDTGLTKLTDINKQFTL